MRTIEKNWTEERRLKACGRDMWGGRTNEDEVKRTCKMKVSENEKWEEQN